MITHMSLVEKNITNKMLRKLAAYYAKKHSLNAEFIYATVADATVELYQKEPFTTAVVKKTVNGKHVRGAGFAKYNPNDSELGPKYQWNDSKGKFRALGRAYHAFITEMIQLNMVPAVTVVAIVSEEAPATEETPATVTEEPVAATV